MLTRCVSALAICLASMLGFGVLPAAATQPPPGHGLVTETFSPSVSCTGELGTFAQLVFPPGENEVPGWTLDGRMFLVSRLEINGTFTPTGGSPVLFTESKTWGNRTGLGTVYTCTFHEEFTEPDGTAVIDGTAWIVLVG